MRLKYIDMDTWKRKKVFEHYYNDVKCSYNITADIEITELLREVKERRLKLYPVLIYILAKVVNSHSELRMNMDKDGKLGYWEYLNPAYTIFHRESESFSELWTDYFESFNDFYCSYLKDFEKYGNIDEFSPKEKKKAVFSISAVPWINFTGFNLNLYNSENYLLPIFTFGKYVTKGDGKAYLPLSFQIHHAVCDGYHAGKIFAQIQELCKNREWL